MHGRRLRRSPKLALIPLCERTLGCFDSSVPAESAGRGDPTLGWASIDALHKEFVNLTCVLLHASDQEVGRALRALKAHTEQQFADEDRWIRESCFPTFGGHADEHAAVLASMACVSRKVAAGDTHAARVFARALLDWHAGRAKYLDPRSPTGYTARAWAAGA